MYSGGMGKLLCILVSALLAAPCVAGTLQAGAAKVDITPPADSALPLSGYAGRTEGFEEIHDPLFIRAIVVDDGKNQAVVVTWDLIFVPEDLWQRVSKTIHDVAGIPTDHILIAATHTHGAPNLSRLEKMPDGSVGRKYLDDLPLRAADAVKHAKAALRPARIGYGAGRANVNMNRVARMPEGDWWLGPNPDGPSDKTVGVVRFEDLGGKPIAFLLNYAVHGTVTGPKNYKLTGDLPGACSRFVEDYFGNGVVAAFLAGASGDQDPIYRVGTDLRQVELLGRILGEEAVRVGKKIKTRPGMRIGGAQRVVVCPGRKQANGNSGRQKDGDYVFVDSDPVNIRLGILKLNNIVLAGVSGEVLTQIGTRVKEESPLKATLFVTHANGSSGYIPDDASYERISYEIAVTRLKPGCAENAIVGGLLGMMDGL